jgi:hypothetical protein
LDSCSPDSEGIEPTPHCADAGGDSAHGTYRISIRSHVLVTEPFLVVGLIASIRRILVITLEAATLTKEGAWATEGSSGIFHSSMIELGLLGLLVLVLVVSITLLRRCAPASKELFSHPNHVGQTSRYGLARWQLRRAFEYFEQHLSDEVTALSSSQSQHLQQVDFLASRQHYIKKYEAALNKLGK